MGYIIGVAFGCFLIYLICVGLSGAEKVFDKLFGKGRGGDVVLLFIGLIAIWYIYMFIRMGL